MQGSNHSLEAVTRSTSIITKISISGRSMGNFMLDFGEGIIPLLELVIEAFGNDRIIIHHGAFKLSW